MGELKLGFYVVAAGCATGAVQSLLLIGALRQLDRAAEPARSGSVFGNMNIALCLELLVAFLAVSVLLVLAVLYLMRVRLPGLVLVPVLTVQYLGALLIGSSLPGTSDNHAWVLVPVLVAELLGCRLLPRRPRPTPPVEHGNLPVTAGRRPG